MPHRRQNLASERPGITKKLTIPAPDGELACYVTVSFFEDGRPGEVLLRANKQGSAERGLLHTLGIMISLLLQHGVKMEKIVEKLQGVAFDPAGMTGDKAIPMVTSIVDYLAKWLSKHEFSQKH